MKKMQPSLPVNARLKEQALTARHAAIKSYAEETAG